MNCANCRYSFDLGVDKNSLQQQMDCRRYPPHVQIIPGPNGMQRIACFPPIEGGFSCGEYAPKSVIMNQ